MNVTRPLLSVVCMPRRNVDARPSKPPCAYCEYRPSASHCQMSTVAPDRGGHPLFALLTVMVSVSGVPVRSSRTSLRIMSVNDGYGPIVSGGRTARAALGVPGGGVVVLVV